MNNTTIQYATFGQRFAAMIIDNIVFSIVLAPIFMIFFEPQTYTQAQLEAILHTQGPLGLINPSELLIQQSIIIILTIFFWVRYLGTPGKRLLKLKIVDIKTGKALTPLQSLVRYLGYFICSLPLGLGFLWILFDAKNQGWHDKLAHSAVIKDTTSIKRNNHRTSQSSVIHHGDNDTFAA